MIRYGAIVTVLGLITWTHGQGLSKEDDDDGDGDDGLNDICEYGSVT